MKKITLALCLLIISKALLAQSNLQLNKKAPEIHITHWVSNVPSDKKLSGKYIVLEFWATWCGPCIAAVPHMNELQAQTNHPDLVFLSITDEAINKINRTIEKIDFQSVVVTDTTTQTQVNFGNGKTGLDTYPLTVLIDQQGIVKWIGEPKQLTVTTLNDFLDNQLDGINHFEVKESQEEEASISRAEVSPPTQDKLTNILKDKDKLFFVELSQTKSKEPYSTSMGKNAVSMSFVSIKDIYRAFFDMQIKSSPLVDSPNYDFTYKNVNKNADRLREVEPLLLSTLGLERQTKMEEVTKYVIKIEDETKLRPALETLFSMKSDAEDKLILTNYSIAAMIKDMAYELNTAIHYSGKDEKKYDFILAKNNFEAFRSDLEGYGFVIEKVISKEEVVYILEKE